MTMTATNPPSAKTHVSFREATELTGLKYAQVARLARLKHLKVRRIAHVRPTIERASLLQYCGLAD